MQLSSPPLGHIVFYIVGYLGLHLGAGVIMGYLGLHLGAGVNLAGSRGSMWHLQRDEAPLVLGVGVVMFRFAEVLD